jgi:ArsR family transcriptional regulator
MSSSILPQTPASAILHPVDETNLKDQLLALCKASADPLRLNILRVLSRDSFGVLELCQILSFKQTAMSHHLKILTKAGLVTSRREGNSIFYRRPVKAANVQLDGLQRTLFSSVDQLPLGTDIEQQISQVQAERAKQSQQFFAENADKFQQQQEQVADYSLYGQHTLELLDQPRGLQHGRVLELGPGEGSFLKELSARFEQVVALDNSAAMLEKAQQNAGHLDNIQFIHGDSKHPALSKQQFDCAVVNMVLHHIPSPAEIFQDLARVLTHGGQLYITDLCYHDQSWVREACGDLWLGFEADDLTQWAAEAGLKENESIYLAQRNGFRVQIRQFIKTPDARR